MLTLGMPDMGFLLKIIYDNGNFQCFHDSSLEIQIYNPFKLKQSLWKFNNYLVNSCIVCTQLGASSYQPVILAEIIYFKPMPKFH